MSNSPWPPPWGGPDSTAPDVESWEASWSARLGAKLIVVTPASKAGIPFPSLAGLVPSPCAAGGTEVELKLAGDWDPRWKHSVPACAHPEFSALFPWTVACISGVLEEALGVGIHSDSASNTASQSISNEPSDRGGVATTSSGLSPSSCAGVRAPSRRSSTAGDGASLASCAHWEHCRAFPARPLAWPTTVGLLQSLPSSPASFPDSFTVPTLG